MHTTSVNKCLLSTTTAALCLLAHKAPSKLTGQTLILIKAHHDYYNIT